MNILDIILIGVIVISGLVGYFKGLIRTVFGLVALILTIILTLMFTPVASNYVMEKTQFDEGISEKTIELLGIEKIGNLKESIAIQEISKLSLPENIIESLRENYTLEALKEFNTSSVSEYIGMGVANMAVKALVFLVLFFIISMLLNAIVTLLDLISRLPVIKQANNIGGLGIGLIFGIGIVWVGMLGLSFVIAIQATGDLSQLIESSILTKLFYYNNPLQNFVMSLSIIK